MAKPDSQGEGVVVIPVEQVNNFIHKAIGLPSEFFVVIGKAKVLTDGALEAKYNFDTSGQPAPPEP
jgi:hypothetical protein